MQLHISDGRAYETELHIMFHRSIHDMLTHLAWFVEHLLPSIDNIFKTTELILDNVKYKFTYP